MPQRDSFEEEGEVSLDVLQEDKAKAVNDTAKNDMANDGNNCREEPKAPYSSTKQNKKVPGRVKTNTKKGTVLNAIPKFNDRGICCNCKSDQAISEAICCHLCGDRFHACCREKTGNLSSFAICPPTSHKTLMPLIAKYGQAHASRWGHIMFLCNKCEGRVSSFKNSSSNIIKVDSECNTSIDTVTTGSNTDDISSFQVAASNVIKIEASCNTSVDTVSTASNTDNLITTFQDSAMSCSSKAEVLTTGSTSYDSNSDGHIPDKHTSEPTTDSAIHGWLESFKDNLLLSVENLISDKLKSHTDSMLSVTSQQHVRPSEELSVASSEISFDPISSSALANPSLPPSYDLGTVSYSNVLQTSPETPSSSSSLSPTEIQQVQSPSNSTTKINRDLNKGPREDDHIVVLRVAESSMDIATAKEIASKALKSIPVNSMKDNAKSNKIVIHFPTSHEKEKGKSALTSSLTDPNIIVDDGRKMFPKITVTNIPNYLISHIISETPAPPVSQLREKLSAFLKERFLEKNEVVQKMVENDNKTFDIVYVKSGHSYTTVGIKVSPVIRKFLMDQGCVYIGETRCKVTDRMDLKQCFKCQKIGHISTNCKEVNTICMYCSASHLTSRCPYKNIRERYRCTNCSHSDNEDHRDNCNTHHSSEESCPSIQHELEKLKSRTEYSKNM